MTLVEFKAPWGRMLRLATIFSLVVLGIICVVGLVSMQQMPWFGSLVLMGMPLLVLASAAPFMVRGYVLSEEALIVKRLGWRTVVPLAGLQSVSGDAEAMHGAWRVFGNGGLLSFTGVFWSKRLRRFRAFVTDWDRAVVLRYPNRTIVISPHDPQQFIVRARTFLKSAAFQAATQRASSLP